MENVRQLLESLVKANDKDELILWITTDMITEMPHAAIISVHKNGHDYRILFKQSAEDKGVSNTGKIEKKTAPDEFFKSLQEHVQCLPRIRDSYNGMNLDSHEPNIKEFIYLRSQ